MGYSLSDRQVIIHLSYILSIATRLSIIEFHHFECVNFECVNFMSITRKWSAKQQRTLELLIRLKRLYPDAKCTLNYETPVQLLVATILSAQCTDERVNQVTPELFRQFPDAPALANADLEVLENLVRSTGFYRNKAKNIQAACQMIVTEFGGQIPKQMELLLKLPGVARKTANVVLAHAYGIYQGVTVDTHVKRLSQRLGLTEHSDPIRIERDLIRLLPQEDWETSPRAPGAPVRTGRAVRHPAP